MTTVVRRIVNAMTDEQRIQLIRDHQLFEKNGFIGDCLLRQTAADVCDTFGGHGGNPPIWMEAVANAAYRNFALRFIEGMNREKRC